MKIKIEIIDPISNEVNFTITNDQLQDISKIEPTKQQLANFDIKAIDFYYDNSSVNNEDQRYLLKILKRQLRIANIKAAIEVINDAKLAPSCGEFIVIQL